MLNRPYQMSMTWFEGVVEGRQDPLEIGRVQVRVFGIHSDNLQDIPTNDLQFMQIMMPVTSASNSGTGESSSLLEGTHVIGFFRDGESCQDGVVMGTVGGIPNAKKTNNKGFEDLRTTIPVGKPSSYEIENGILKIKDVIKKSYPTENDVPDLSRLARGKDLDNHHIIKAKKISRANQTNIKIAGGGTFSEPDVETSTTYPYNSVKESESGHILELNDTPSKERVMLAHRNGCFVEMRSSGDFVFKSARDLYSIIHGDSYEHVNGNKTITIDKGVKLLVNASGGNSFDIEVGSGGDININILQGNVNLDVKGDMKHTVSGDYVLEVGQRFKLTATRIDLN